MNTTNSVAALRVDRMKLADLAPHPRNHEIRNHPDPGTPRWETLKSSLAHDYFDPLVWNVRNGFLVSGHLRHKIMLEIGYKEADVVVVDYDEPTHIARMLAANRGIGVDDKQGQKSFFEELLSVTDFDFAITGFTESDIEQLTATAEAMTTHAVNDALNEWTEGDLPDFKVPDKDIKLTVIFRTKDERFQFVIRNNIQVTSVKCDQFVSRIEDAEAGRFIKNLSSEGDQEPETAGG